MIGPIPASVQPIFEAYCYELQASGLADTLPRLPAGVWGGLPEWAWCSVFSPGEEQTDFAFWQGAIYVA